MISEITSPAVDSNEEMSALIETLLATEQRLEELTAGEVDTVAGRDGRTFLLRRAQEQLRHSEAAKQAGILNALPAHIALLDTQGSIVSVNEAWRRFAVANVLPAPGHGVGLNYLAICDRALGPYSSEAHQVAAGIRAVLEGREKSYSIEYPCHSSTAQRWFLLTVTPLANDRPNGALVMHLNITKSKQSEIASNHLAAIVESSADAIIGKDLNSNITSWNKGAESIFGYTASEMVGTSIQRLITPERHNEESEILRRVERGEGIDQFETVRLTKDRQRIDVSLTISPIKDGEGNLVGVAHVARDITERRRAAEALHTSQKRLRDLIDGVGPAIFVGLMTLEGILIECNRPALAAAGLKPEDVLGLPFAETYWFSHSPEVQRQLRETITRGVRGEASRYDMQIRGAENDFIDVDFSLQPLRDETGEVVFLIPSASIITERKRAEERFRVSEERLRAALSASRTGTFGWDIRTNELSWDESLDALFGIPQGQAIRSLETFIATVHPDDRPQVIERCERCARDGADFDMEFRVVWPDGTLHWLDDKGKTFFDVAGKPLYMIGACVDITERKLAETALRESEAEFRALAEAMPQMVWITRADGGNIYFSQQWMDYTGLTLEESLGHGWNKPFHPEDQQRAWDAWQQATATNGAYSIESRLRRADGVYRWWLIRGVPQLDSVGNINKWFGTCTDIHELKLAELEISRTNRELRDSDEKFRQLADNIADVFYMTSPDMQQMHYVSPAYELIWGRSVADLYAHPQEWAEAILPEDRERVWATFSTIGAGATSVSAEFRIARPDGALRWILSRGFPVRNAAGKLVRLTGIATDITERKYAEDTLRETEERFSGAFEHAPIGMALVSPEGRFLRVNRGLCDLVGYSETELLARTFQDITHPTDIARSEQNVRRVHAGPDRSFQMEKLYVHKRGRLITALVSISLVRDSQGQPSYFIGQIQDISERKKLEAQLRQAQKMEAIGTLAGGIAHDFNNILAAISGYSELAQKCINRDSRAQSHLEQVLIASNRGRDLVLQILAFSRQEEPERKTLKLQPIIAETLKLLRVSLPATVEIRQHIDPTTPPVLGDATQIQRVTMNLCVNALQAMKERGGIVEVRLTNIDVDRDLATAHPELKEGPHICLTVSDTGCGMDRATQERIFDPFFTTKAPGEGTGLGLAVVHGVIKNHDGAIVVSSELGVGTAFSVYLPVSAGPQASIIPESNSMQPGNGTHILLVDDENALVSLGRSMLQHLGHRVTAMTDSVAALAAFKSQPEDFDLVITDQTMPHLNGADLAKALLEIRPTLPVILVTGYSAAITSEKAKAIGIRELLYKPNTMQELGEAIQRALG